jgi:hypothetical protein
MKIRTFRVSETGKQRIEGMLNELRKEKYFPATKEQVQWYVNKIDCRIEGASTDFEISQFDTKSGQTELVRLDGDDLEIEIIEDGLDEE